MQIKPCLRVGMAWRRSNAPTNAHAHNVYILYRFQTSGSSFLTHLFGSVPISKHLWQKYKLAGWQYNMLQAMQMYGTPSRPQYSTHVHLVPDMVPSSSPPPLFPARGLHTGTRVFGRKALVHCALIVRDTNTYWLLLYFCNAVGMGQ